MCVVLVVLARPQCPARSCFPPAPHLLCLSLFQPLSPSQLPVSPMAVTSPGLSRPQTASSNSFLLGVYSHFWAVGACPVEAAVPPALCAPPPPPTTPAPVSAPLPASSAVLEPGCSSPQLWRRRGRRPHGEDCHWSAGSLWAQAEVACLLQGHGVTAAVCFPQRVNSAQSLAWVGVRAPGGEAQGTRPGL